MNVNRIKKCQVHSKVDKNPNWENFWQILGFVGAPCLTWGLFVQASSVNVQTFSPSSSSNYVLTENAQRERPHGLISEPYKKFTLGLNYNYFDEPLVELTEDRTERLGVLVNSIQTFDFLGGMDFNGRVSINVVSSIHMVDLPNRTGQFTTGDVRIYPKIFAFRDQDDTQPFTLAFIPEARFAPGNQDLFVSDGSFGGGLTVAIERDFRVFRMAANIGYQVSPRAVYRDLDNRQKLPLRLGAHIPIIPRWALNLEGSATLSIPQNRYQNPSEVYGGLKYQLSDTLVATGGASFGRTNFVASGDYRVLFGLRLTPLLQNDSVHQILPIASIPDSRGVEAPKAPEIVQAPASQIVKLGKKRVFFTKRKLRITEEIKFEHDRDVLTDSGRNLLDEVAQVIKKNKGRFKKIRIEGHANELGTENHNMLLSRARTQSVREYLQSRGVSKFLLVNAWYGETRLKEVAGVSREALLQLNRRVEFFVVK